MAETDKIQSRLLSPLLWAPNSESLYTHYSTTIHHLRNWGPKLRALEIRSGPQTGAHRKFRGQKRTPKANREALTGPSRSCQHTSIFCHLGYCQHCFWQAQRAWILRKAFISGPSTAPACRNPCPSSIWP